MSAARAECKNNTATGAHEILNATLTDGTFIASELLRVLAGAEKVQGHVFLVTHHPAIVRLGRNFDDGLEIRHLANRLKKLSAFQVGRAGSSATRCSSVMITRLNFPAASRS